jgi:hypothetical protein
VPAQIPESGGLLPAVAVMETAQRGMDFTFAPELGLFSTARRFGVSLPKPS